jgi:TolB-like protein
MSGDGVTDCLLFEGFRLDRRGLFRQDPTGTCVPVALGSRALDLLLLLARHSGAVVLKDDLMSGIWPGIAVEESNLTKQISALRRALDRTPWIGSCIQTVPSRGYRFVATVTQADRAAAEPPTAFIEKPSIAVLPFHNLSGDPDQDYFADGMAEEITTATARFPWLFVLAWSSSCVYTGKAVDGRQVARELGVRYVLQGSVRRDGNRVRITCDLVDAMTARHIWGDRFDGTLGDIFALQDRGAAAFVGAIEPRLRLAEIERVSRKPAENLDAYDLTLRALALMSKRTKQGFAEAVALLHRALKLDAGYAPAMAQLGYSRLMQATWHWIPLSGSEVDEGVASRSGRSQKPGTTPRCSGRRPYAGLLLWPHRDRARRVRPRDRPSELCPRFRPTGDDSGLAQSAGRCDRGRERGNPPEPVRSRPICLLDSAGMGAFGRR